MEPLTLCLFIGSHEHLFSERKNANLTFYRSQAHKLENLLKSKDLKIHFKIKIYDLAKEDFDMAELESMIMLSDVVIVFDDDLTSVETLRLLRSRIKHEDDMTILATNGKRTSDLIKRYPHLQRNEDMQALSWILKEKVHGVQAE